MTREEKATLGAFAAVFAAVVVWGFASGAFAGNAGTPGVPDPLPPKPTPDPGTLPGPRPAHVDPLEASNAPGDVPPELAEIAAGGVPIADGWEVLAWYSYRGHWIRVDIRPDVDSGPGHEHGQYRWTVVGGAATPLASWSTEGKGFGEVVTFDDENADWVASHAAEWIDAIVG